MSILIPIVLSILAVAFLLLAFPLIMGMAGGSSGAIVIFAVLIIAPIAAIVSWVIYGFNAGLASAGVPYGWLIGLVVAFGIVLFPRYVLAPAADRMAASYQAQDSTLPAIPPLGTIAFHENEVGTHHRAARSRTDIIARLLKVGFDGVLILTGDGDDEVFDHYTATRTDDDLCPALQAIDPAQPSEITLTEDEFAACITKSQQPLSVADFAFLTEIIVENPRILGLPHRFEIRRERVVQRTGETWQETGRETWVSYHRFRAPIPIPSQPTLKPKGRACITSLRGVLPSVWPDTPRLHMHAPQSVVRPWPVFAAN